MNQLQQLSWAGYATALEHKAVWNATRDGASTTWQEGLRKDGRIDGNNVTHRQTWRLISYHSGSLRIVSSRRPALCKDRYYVHSLPGSTTCA